MNVVVVSDHGLQGGAAVAGSRIALSIERHNPGDSLQRITFFAEGTASQPLWYEEGELKRQAYRFPRKILPTSFPRPNSEAFAAQRLRAKLAELRPDIINVHNLHAAAPWGWGPHLVEVCLEFAPVVWTLHDMWSFTGRCAYSYDCRRFITGCDASCPTPMEMPALAPERIRPAWEERRALYARHPRDLVIVTPSRWLADEARAGLFARHRVEVIPYGVPLPEAIAHDDARRELGIPSAARVLLSAAFDLSERRKGAEILASLWRHVQSRPIIVLMMGKGNVAIDDPRVEVRHLGFLDDEHRKALAYSAADAILHPAPVDNFPNVVLEAMACGTPTIALPVGGLPEMVRPGVSGWLAPQTTPAALGATVERALNDVAVVNHLRESCRALADREYSLELQGGRYIHLFEELRRR
jgi:glycosyltransferase involved in cell wall biosynthesis